MCLHSCPNISELVHYTNSIKQDSHRVIPISKLCVWNC